ncbi:UNVERIFIED_CONTAM: hypothetical protein HDU68_006117 [Siphonaria sp. JEL0065]|nr:hypothetical protein HDU68_006117 [Siphonaria sp. JEL0065]
MQLIPLILLCLSLTVNTVCAYKPPGLLSPNSTGKAVPTKYDYRQSFKKPYYYHNDKSQVPYFDISPHAIPNDEAIRLASSVPYAQGSIWVSQPNPHKEWIVTLKFLSFGRAREHGGDGLAFWYTKSKDLDGPIFGGRDMWTGLGLLFDSSDEVTERWMPAIAGVVNDGTRRIVGRDALSKEMEAVGSCFRNYRNTQHPVHIKISYISQKLEVSIDHLNNGNSFIACFSAENVVLPSGYYFGFSAANSMHLYDDHDVLALEVKEANPKPKNENTKEYKLDEETIKEIERIDELVDQIRHQEDQDFVNQEAFFVGPEDVLELRQTQLQILNALSTIEARFYGSDTGSAASNAAIDQTMARMIAPIDRKVAEMKSTITELESQLSGLNKNIQLLHEALQRFEQNGNAHMNNIVQAIGVSHDKIDRTHSVVASTRHHYFTYIVCLSVGGVLVYVGRVMYKMWVRDRMPKRYL